MKITYDTNKDRLNLQKHGLSLSESSNIEWDTLYAYSDTRTDYGETRYVGYAILRERLYCVVFTDRGDTRRIISLRKANNREVKSYAANY